MSPDSTLTALTTYYYLKASVCYFYQNFNIHTLRCEFLYVHDDTQNNISKGEKNYSKSMDFISMYVFPFTQS